MCEDDSALPEDVRALIVKAKDSWLKNTEIYRILTCLWDGKLVPLTKVAPAQPPGMAELGGVGRGCVHCTSLARTGVAGGTHDVCWVRAEALALCGGEMWGRAWLSCPCWHLFCVLCRGDPVPHRPHGLSELPAGRPPVA